MKKLISNNRLYFSYMLAFAAMGGAFLLYLQKGDEILFFNIYRQEPANDFFRLATKLGEAPVYVMLAILALLYRVRYSLLIALTGFLVLGFSHGLKMFFALDRPAAFFQKLNRIAEVTMVTGVDVHTGATSFPSGHTMSAFAMYSLLAFLLPKRKRIATVLFLTALLVGLSRVFLVQHFWEDVYAGALFGFALAVAVYLVQARYEDDPVKWIDRPLLRWRKGGKAA